MYQLAKPRKRKHNDLDNIIYIKMKIKQYLLMMMKLKKDGKIIFINYSTKDIFLMINKNYKFNNCIFIYKLRTSDIEV